jgi:hypothetical protein
MEVDVLNYRYFDEVNIIVPKKHNERFKLIMEGKREDSALLVYENATTIRLINFR